ncbi:unnamed protein product [Paramecium octaurelia]|uniref:Uncharacterized protein n=1 Tax=Paramecium octaurelia TaxID=43137 RepID=A0A8S1TZ86_PAROT|nr:unnamed protein product [Paramecium octaurelia]
MMQNQRIHFKHSRKNIQLTEVGGLVKARPCELDTKNIQKAQFHFEMLLMQEKQLNEFEEYQ